VGDQADTSHVIKINIAGLDAIIRDLRAMQRLGRACRG
jgi:hypothetical protein